MERVVDKTEKKQEKKKNWYLKQGYLLVQTRETINCLKKIIF